MSDKLASSNDPAYSPFPQPTNAEGILQYAVDQLVIERDELRAEVERLRAALSEITDLELEGDASVGDAIVIADEALNPPPV